MQDEKGMTEVKMVGISQARILGSGAISFSRASNLSLLQWQADSLPLSHLGNPRVLNTKDKLTL